MVPYCGKVAYYLLIAKVSMSVKALGSNETIYLMDRSIKNYYIAVANK